MRVLLAFICSCLLLTSHSLMAKQNSCSLPSINNQCNSLDVDQSGPTGALLPNSALNPIDLFSGNKYLREVDLYAHPDAPSLEIVRHYNAMSIHYGDLGGAWSLSYETRLLVSNTAPVSISLHQANGTLRPLTATEGYLERHAERLIWHYANGDKWHFNAAGWLIQLQRQGQAPLFIERHTHGVLQHKIKRIEQNQRQLLFGYQDIANQILLKYIYSPNGIITYHYDQAESSELYQLKTVKYPDTRRVYYHYESAYQSSNRWALTGKSIQQTPNSLVYRVRSWVYDLSGRAIFVMAEQTEKWVRIYYPDTTHPTQTRLHSKNGITYIDFSASNKPRIQSVKGAECWACPPPLTRTPTAIQFKHFTVHHVLGNESQITKITGQFDGWPKLALHYTQGKLSSWQNTLQQPTQLFYSNGKANRLRFANGDEQHVHYNALQQVSHIQYQNPHETLQTQLQRPSPNHLHIHHPHETEKLVFNSAAKIVNRHVQRQLSTPSGTIQWHYNESFIYDEQYPQRLLRHSLPEGGVLHYIWSEETAELQGIEWENPQGKRQLVVNAITQGYAYGNGLQQLHSQYGQVHIQQLHTTSPQRVWWRQRLVTHHDSGLVIQKRQHFPIISASTTHQSDYHYNHKKQLIIENNHADFSLFYAWHSSGALAAHNLSALPTMQRDASGLVHTWQEKNKDYMLRYNSMRRLDIVYNSENTVQKNSHNAAGYRIYTQHYPQATQQFFLYDSKKIVAEYTVGFSAKLPTHAAHPISRRYIYLHNQPVGLIDYSVSQSGELLVMHSDHLGGVHLISDAKQRLRWAATYNAFGTATKIAGDPTFTFHLRREGQYYDLSTGWHDNLLRTYLPQYGYYLEPDPLGPNPTTQLVGYAKQQHLNHTDPWGLILFSFDGTRYDQSSGGVVHLLNKAAKEESYYVAGPGNPDTVDWDAAVSYTTDKILRQQWDNLINHLHYVQTNTPTALVPIDIIAFSRGAAIALHFANQITKYTQNGLFSYTDRYGDHVSACVQPRFMGLLDNVAQMGILGAKNYQYDFTVSPAWQWVVHGVAMHEHRYLFPLYSIGTGSNIQEVGFIGAHGDLGGGYPMADHTELTPLSDVALQWILWNARAQGMQFNEIELKAQGDYAYMHDESVALEIDRDLENYKFKFNIDSDVRGKQALHTVYGQQARAQVNQFIDFNLRSEEKVESQIGKVDLNAYYRWLDQTLNWSPE